MLTFWPDVDVAASTILMAQPRKGLDDSVSIPDARDHDRLGWSCIWLEEPDFKQFRTHRCDLLPDCNSCSVARVARLRPALAESIHVPTPLY